MKGVTMITHPALVSERVPTHRRSLIARIMVGDRGAPDWARPSLLALLVVSAALYFWNLSDSAYANSFYAAAVEAGSKSWKALFFGSLDSANFITVDKPPASLWIMGLSARLFGFSSWSVLAPQAVMGVAAVALLFGAVRRSLLSCGPKISVVGAVIAGFTLAFTPAAALMFRFDNPDALLTLLMTAAAYCVVRALPRASLRWLALAGVALGCAFLTKMLQGLLVLPAFGLVYLVAAPTLLWKRIVHLLVAAGALVISAAWWLVIVALFPASARPYIGGSTNNTVLDLVFGYNGFGRIFGGAGNGGGANTGASGSSFGGATGVQRLFSSEMGVEISWVLPAALIALVLGLVVTRRRGRTDALRAAFLLWGGWLVVTGLVFSYMSGTVHPYYTVALAPAIAALVALGGVVLWTVRQSWLGRIGLAVMMVASGAWAFTLLTENATSFSWLRWVILVGVALSVVVFLSGSVRAAADDATGLRAKRAVTLALVFGLLFSLGGAVAYSIATASVAHSGSIPSVGSTADSAAGMGAALGGSGPGAGGGGTRPGNGNGNGAGNAGAATAGAGTTGEMPPPGGAANGPSIRSTGGGAPTAALDALLATCTARWAAAVDGSQSAATLELSSSTAVMAIGGWSDDPTPTLAKFESFVRAGNIGYYVVSERRAGGPNSSSGLSGSSAIEAWVKANFTATTVGGSTVYRLSK